MTSFTISETEVVVVMVLVDASAAGAAAPRSLGFDLMSCKIVGEKLLRFLSYIYDAQRERSHRSQKSKPV
jgi:hypothetical protein